MQAMASTRLGSNGVRVPNSKNNRIDNYMLQLDDPYNLPPQLQQKILSAARILAREHKDDNMPSSVYVKTKNRGSRKQKEKAAEDTPIVQSKQTHKHSVLSIVCDQPLMPLLDIPPPSRSPPPAETVVNPLTQSPKKATGTKTTTTILGMKRNRKLFFRRLSKLEPRISHQSIAEEGLSSALNSSSTEEAPVSIALFDECIIQDETASMSPKVSRSPTSTIVFSEQSPASQCFSTSTTSSLSMYDFNGKVAQDNSGYTSFSESTGSSKVESSAGSLFLKWLDSTLDIFSNGASICSSTRDACVAPRSHLPEGKSSRELRAPF